MASAAEIKALCQQSLENANVGTGVKELQNGKDFYKLLLTRGFAPHHLELCCDALNCAIDSMFGNFPDLRVYFKGAENFTPDDVQKSERFEKQGQRILLACHIIASTFDKPDVFKAYARETVNRHRQFKIDPALWSAFFAVFVGYLKTKTSLTPEQEKAWMELGKVFADECLVHLKALGLPH